MLNFEQIHRIPEYKEVYRLLVSMHLRYNSQWSEERYHQAMKIRWKMIVGKQDSPSLALMKLEKLAEVRNWKLPHCEHINVTIGNDNRPAKYTVREWFEEEWLRQTADTTYEVTFVIYGYFTLIVDPYKLDTLYWDMIRTQKEANTNG